MSGVFIAFEGPEGAGKSTQVRRLERWLRDRGHDPLVTREPGGTPVAEEVRRILLGSDALSARTELLLMLASRSALVEEVIRPALADGRVVVTDRFHLSTLAYQGYGRELPLEDVVRMNPFATGGLEPDLTVLLDVDPGVGAARKRAAGGGADRIERAGDAFHRRVAEAYRLLAEREDRIERVDATGPEDAVHAEVVALLVARFPETFGEPAG
ncbi:MAG: dTMP kinase [Gemmatimonadetes bacterium]|nr:dTMP kinase [Gemmatimonadota bacterium]NIQ54444.1 dTMP kinase [Gemmatimonadota bacterium]NIU74652.1 dTMP kinase [Gammaproteobacteria bacterium]NIX44583.1 dTMP kinase [Gemmatimonadota bacterium]NIY08793.1 dTMP kinase [Gemmatimonadota bacterium]